MSIFLLNTFMREKRTSDLAHKFSIWCEPMYINAYVNHVFFEWYLGGFYAKRNVVDIIMGYDDPILMELKDGVKS